MRGTVDRPAATWRRYNGLRPTIENEIWGPTYHPRRIRSGTGLCIALTAPARVHWGINGWNAVRDQDTRDTGLGVHTADLPVSGLAAGESIQFTFRWRETGAWEGRDHVVLVTA